MAEFTSAIPPGGSGTVVAKVHTQGQAGPRTKNVALETNDPARPRANLTFRYEVVAAIVVTPPVAVFRGVQGDRLQQILVLERPDGRPLELTDVTVSEPTVVAVQEAVTPENADPPGAPAGARPGDIRLRLSLAESATPRRTQAQLRMRTNHPDKPELSLPVSIIVERLVQATPPRIDLQWGPTGPSTGRVSLAHGAARAFRVTAASLTGDLPGWAARVVSAAASPVQVIEVVASPDAAPPAPGAHRGALVAATDLEAAAKIEIPVVLRAPPRPADQ